MKFYGSLLYGFLDPPLIEELRQKARNSYNTALAAEYSALAAKKFCPPIGNNQELRAFSCTVPIDYPLGHYKKSPSILRCFFATIKAAKKRLFG